VVLIFISMWRYRTYNVLTHPPPSERATQSVKLLKVCETPAGIFLFLYEVGVAVRDLPIYVNPGINFSLNFVLRHFIIQIYFFISSNVVSIDIIQY
jgi:hypothetical protein